MDVSGSPVLLAVIVVDAEQFVFLPKAPFCDGQDALHRRRLLGFLYHVPNVPAIEQGRHAHFTPGQSPKERPPPGM